MGVGIIFCQLLCKNLRTDVRSWLKLLFEIFIVVTINGIINSDLVTNTPHYPQHNHRFVNRGIDRISDEIPLKAFEQRWNFAERSLESFDLAYAPAQSLVGTFIANEVKEKLKLRRVIAFNNTKELESKFNSHTMIAGLNFHSDPNVKAPKFLNVDLRFPAALRTRSSHQYIRDELWNAKCLDDVHQSRSFTSLDSTPKIIYFDEGFLNIQDEVFRAWVKSLIGEHKTTNIPITEPDYNVNLRTFTYKGDNFACTFSQYNHMYHVLVNFMFLLPFCDIIWKVGREVEQNIMTNHWQYRCPITLHWCAHVIISMLHLLFLDFIIIVMNKIPWTNTSQPELSGKTLGELALFLVVYNLSLILTAIFIASSIADAGSAVLIGIIIWLFMFGVFFSTLIFDRTVAMVYVYIAIVLFFNNSFDYTYHFLKYHENTDTVNIYFMCYALAGNIALIIITMFLYFLAFEFRYLARNTFSVPVKIRNRRDKFIFPRFIFASKAADINNFENARYDVTPLLSCRNIVTIRRNNLRNKSVHIKNVSLAICPNEITVLLGPTGSGKTTMIRLFAGLLQPDYGYVFYNKNALARNWGKFNHFCDTLMDINHTFDLLTVQETLSYYIRIKGKKYNGRRRDQEIKKWMKYLKVVISNTEAYVKTLTFEQQRFLCLCAVLSCDTQIILLDEPTEHLRTKEQHFFWKILKENKDQRIIVVTTVDMDEAEEIGDRIAIFSKGRVKAFGSVFFLKQAIRTRFQIIILKESSLTPTQPIADHISTINDSLQSYSEVGEQVIYSVPVKDKELFQKIVIQIQKESKNLGIKRVYVLDFAFNEVICMMDFHNNRRNIEVAPNFAGFLAPVPVRKKHAVIRQHFRALFHFRFYHQSFLIPAVFIIFSFFVVLFLVNSLKTTNVIKVSGKMMDSFRSISDPGNHIKFVSNDCSSLKKENKTKAACDFRNLNGIKGTDSGIRLYGAVQPSFESEGSTNENTIWINQNTLHASPHALNLLHNAILRQTFPDDADIMVQISNIPFAPTKRDSALLNSYDFSFFIFPISVGITWPMLCATYILMIVDNKLNNIYTLFEIAGMKVPIYWFVNFLWDLLEHCMFAVCFLSLSALVPIHEIYFRHKFIVFFLLAISGFPIIWGIYFLSLFMKHSKMRAYLWACIWGLLSGIVLFLLYWEVGRQIHVLYHIFSLLPQFALIHALASLHLVAYREEACSKRCSNMEGCDDDNLCQKLSDCCNANIQSLFTWEEPTLLKTMLYMMGSSLLFALLCSLVLIRRRDRKYRLTERVKKYRSYFFDTDDDNVVGLRKYIANLSLSQCKRIRVCVDQIEHSLPKHTNRLKTVSFNVDKYCCLCIYGGHHSDKTHLARQLVGDLGFQFGEVYMRGLDFRRNLVEVRKILGYCPQKGGICDNLTAYQTFHIFYLLRGVPHTILHTRITYLMSLLGLRHTMHRKVGDLKIAEKRKIKLGIAMISLNKILVLDEPTRGLDGAAKTEIWQIIRVLCDKGRAVIVFTTDTVECKFLANYVLLVEHYEMLAYGHFLGIYERYSLGFILKVKIKSEGTSIEQYHINLLKDFDNIVRLAKYLHDDSKEISRSGNYIQFYCPVKRVSFSALYDVMEKNKERLNIADYSIEFVPMSDILEKLEMSRAQARSKVSASRVSKAPKTE